MPDKPTWINRLDEITRELRKLPDPWVSTPQVQELLGIGNRRAQQVLAPCRNQAGVAERETVIENLRRLAAKEDPSYEQHRRKGFAERMGAIYKDRKVGLLVAAPTSIVNQNLEGLPAGVAIEPGSITLHFSAPQEALQQLLSLAMAIRNDQDLFERMASPVPAEGATS